ncbi:MAG: hypothetical protein PHV57_07485, partial [Methanomicrobiaceae archaeon]|nr:hypothetical protein [Methanomicrobiaceae archaeon]
MKRKITILALGLLLAAALAAAPASARTAAHEIESGDIIYIGESGLDLTGFGEVNRLVMCDRGTIHNIIPVTNPEDFDVLEVYVGTNTGHYIVEDADREE